MRIGKLLIVFLVWFAVPELSGWHVLSSLHAQQILPPDSTVIIEDEDEIIINNKLFNKKNHWITVGSGYGLYLERQAIHTNFGADLHARIYDKYLTAGYFYTGRKFLTKSWGIQLHDIHLGYGWRKESLHHNHYVFAGPSLAMGYQFSYQDTVLYNGVPTVREWDEGFIQPGLYAEYQYTFKFNYDLGIGLAAYVALSRAYQTAGLKAIIYISTAYVGKAE